jgi:serine/threonine-protein kinase HipA
MPASVRIHGQHAGVLDVDGNGGLTFQYDSAWVERGRAKPYGFELSLRLPLSSKQFDDDLAAPYFRGMLPEDAGVRRSLAEELGLGPDDDYALLLAMGRDCPGAVSVVPVDAPATPDRITSFRYTVIFDDDLADLLKRISEAPLFVRIDGHRSLLGGPRPKAGVVRVNGELGVPKEGSPTTHILKADPADAPGMVAVEFFCLKLAAALEFDVPIEKVDVLEERPYLLMPRFDRVITDGRYVPVVRRLHQEDFCQALGYLPGQYAERDGGPGWGECFRLLEKLSSPDAARAELLRRVVFNYLIGNHHASAKNCSLVYAPDGLRLSKLYGLSNEAAFHHRFSLSGHRMAMSIGGCRNLRHVTRADWEVFADQVSVQHEAVTGLLSDMAPKVAHHAQEVRSAMAGGPGNIPLLDIVVKDILERCDLASSH